MYLYYSVLTPNQEHLDHSVIAYDLEVLLDILNQYVSSGHQLLYAFLLDEQGRRTELPIEAFDGNGISEQMVKLKTEYLRLLNS